MVPNADPFIISGGASLNLTNAQYVASSIELNGNTHQHHHEGRPQRRGHPAGPGAGRTRPLASAAPPSVHRSGDRADLPQVRPLTRGPRPRCRGRWPARRSADDGHGTDPPPGARALRRADRRATTWSRRAWWCSTATGGATRASSTWCCATGRRWWRARSRPAPALDHGTPARGGHRRQARAAAAARRAVGRGARRPPTGDPGRPGRRAAPAQGPGARGARAGDRLMPFATTPTIALDGAVGHLVDVQADVSPGQAGLTMVGRCRRLPQRGAATAAGWRSTTPTSTWPASKRVTILLSPSDLPKRGTHFDLAIALAVLKADRQLPDRRASTGSVFIGELTLGGGLRSVPGVLPMVLAAAAARDPPGLRARAAGARGGDGPRHEVLGMRSLGQVVAELTGEEVPEAPPVAPMSGSRLLVVAGPAAARRGRPGRRARHGRRPLRRRGGGRRRPPPPADRAQGLRQDHARRADPRRSCPTSRSRSRSRSPPSTRWPARSRRATG